MPDQNAAANVLPPFKLCSVQAQLNGLDPAAWLKDTLTKLPTWQNSRIDELLPLTPDFIKALKQKK